MFRRCMSKMIIISNDTLYHIISTLIIPASIIYIYLLAGAFPVSQFRHYIVHKYMNIWMGNCNIGQSYIVYSKLVTSQTFTIKTMSTQLQVDPPDTEHGWWLGWWVSQSVISLTVSQSLTFTYISMSYAVILKFDFLMIIILLFKKEGGVIHWWP